MPKTYFRQIPDLDYVNRTDDGKGISNYTIGQRKGLGLGGYKKPLYVININKTKTQFI